VNQNLLHPDTAPSARALEARVVGWLAPAFGMGGGHMVPGSTVGNLTALWAARELTGARRVVASSAAHLSIAKAAGILGLELVPVPVDERQPLRRDRLPDVLADAVLVLTAGTVATGAIDPLDGDHDAAWRHVGAAWTGSLRFSGHAHLLDGIEAADSVSVSAHKWLYQPKESGLVLFRDPDAAHDAISFGGGYLAEPNIGLLGSHANIALPLAATLVDLDKLEEACAITGTKVLLDTTQAVGWLPIDASRFAFTVCGGYKWLLAPRGTAYLTVQADLLDSLIPHAAGWYAGASPWESIYGAPLRLLPELTASMSHRPAGVGPHRPRRADRGRHDPRRQARRADRRHGRVRAVGAAGHRGRELALPPAGSRHRPFPGS